MTELASAAVLYSQNTFDVANPSDQQMDVMIAAAQQLNTSGFTTVILGQWHVHDDGSVWYNDTAFDDVLNGLQVYVTAIKMGGGSVQKVLVTFGPGGADFDHIGTNMDAVKSAIRTLQVMAGVDGIDFDLEGGYTSTQADTLVSLCQWANGEGMTVTAAPYADWEVQFWQGVLDRVGGGGDTGFAWWNLQMYGGATYSTWRNAVATKVDDAEQFLVPAFKIEDEAPGDLQSAVQAIKEQFSGIDGAGVWKYEYSNHGGNATSEYSAAIRNGLSGA